MFNENQLEVLNQELDSSRIKTREKGNINLSYLEGFDIIETANLIFGFGNWNYLISKLELVSSEMNQNQNHVVCYKAVVKLIVKDENHTKSIFRQDVGFGTGTAKSLADAHENAGKEAVTDSLKRAMRSFGNQFGNSLYDKSRNQNYSNSNNQQNFNQNYTSNNINHTVNANFRTNGNQQQQHTRNQTMQHQTTSQNGNSRNSTNVNQNMNVNQKPLQHNHQQPFQNNQSFDQFEYQPLYNLGLDVIEQNGFLIITGENQYSYRDAIKASGFRFDSKSKTWYKPIEQGVA